MSTLLKETARKVLARATETLTRVGVQSPRLDAELLLAEALGKNRKDLYLDPNRVLTPEQVILADRLVSRRANREPVAYILGRREFWGLEFKVGPGVLIPRPDTETLIEEFLARIRPVGSGDASRILDIGTGCGNIAVAVAKELPHCCLTAVDASPEALGFARENAEAHGVQDRIRFVEGDWFAMEETQVYDAVVANPPYISNEDLPHLMADVRSFEPALALDGGDAGLDFYRRMVPRAWSCLTAGGWLVLEIGEGQAVAVSEIMSRHGGYSAAAVRKDLSGKDRVIAARKISHG